jgi:hypothetical protein
MTTHWTDEQLIAQLYGIGPDDRHLDTCAECQARLSRMQLRRNELESSSAMSEVSVDFIAVQRRKIYAAMDRPVHWWSQLQVRRWGSALAGAGIVASGLLLYESNDKAKPHDSISDAELAQEVSRIAEDPEPPATAPLQALFEE